MKNLRKIALSTLFVVVALSATSCIKPYDKPEFVTIEASQTAFLIPLVGDTAEQASFQSEELLSQAMVATKEVQIPHRWVQTGRWEWQGEWRDSATLIIVERKPVSRSWESGENTAESSNKAIFSETADGIGVYVGMNCSAQIEEKDATKFLYRYNNTPLETIIDTDIKKTVENQFNLEVSKYNSTNLHGHKTEIMENVKTYVVDYFKEYGITITVLGYKEGISFENPEIQNAIDEKYSSEQKLEIQKNENDAALEKAKAEAEALKIAAEAEAEVLKIAAEAEAEANKKIAESLTPELIEKQKLEQWDGTLPQIVSDSTIIKDFIG